MHRLRESLDNITRELEDGLRHIGKARGRTCAMAILVSAGLTLGTLLTIPLFAGTVGLVFDEAGPSATVSLQLALVAAALGGLVLWFAGRRQPKPDENDQLAENREQRITNSVRLLGLFLLVSAMLFTLFALLSPLLPDIKDSTGVLETLARYALAVSFMGGSITLSIALCLGIFEIWLVG